MLAQLKMRLETGDREMGYFQSSSLQGVLMEQLDPDYAEILHRPGFHPYSQYLRQDREQGLCWTVQTVTKEAYEAILLPLLSRDFTAFTIRKRQIPVRIQEKQLKTTAQQALLEEFYDGGRRAPGVFGVFDSHPRLSRAASMSTIRISGCCCRA